MTFHLNSFFTVSLFSHNKVDNSITVADFGGGPDGPWPPPLPEKKKKKKRREKKKKKKGEKKKEEGGKKKKEREGKEKEHLFRFVRT